MRRAVVVSERGRLLCGLLAALAGRELALLVEPTLADAAARLRREPIDLLVVDLAELADAERAQVASLRVIAGRARLLLVVPAERPRLLRAALRAEPDALLLDPFDLAQGAEAVARLLAARPDELWGGERDVPIEALATFLKGLSHEVLNPLMGVSGILQLLRNELGTSPELKARYESMWQCSERIHATLHELEQFVRLRKPQRARIEPAPFLRGLVERWKSGEPPLKISATIQDAIPAILGDAELLAGALRNLVRFAAGADGKGAVALSLEAAAAALEIEVTGSAAVRMPTRPTDLLLPYHDALGSGRPGSLALAAAHGIVRSHRGSLAVEGLPGGGVRFRLSLPGMVDRAEGQDELEGEPA